MEKARLNIDIQPPPFVVDFVSIMPCYRESEQELKVSIANYKWKHAYRASKGAHANTLVLDGEGVAVSNGAHDQHSHYLRQFKSDVRGMLLFIVVDGSSDFCSESNTVRAIRSILEIRDPVQAWRACLGCKLFELDNYAAFEDCKVVVVVKGPSVFKGKRFSQVLCCRMLLGLTQRYPQWFAPENVLLTDADTAFTVSDIAKSVRIMRRNPRLGAFNVSRRLLNASNLSPTLLLQSLEYHQTIMMRTIDSGLGYITSVDGSFLVVRFAALCDILDDYSVVFDNTPTMRCKFNACNLGEDTFMARLVNYHGWDCDQISDPRINHFVNGVETLPELFDQRRRWWNNGLAHALSNLQPKVDLDEPAKWNHAFRTVPRLIGYVLLAPAFRNTVEVFIAPGRSLALWSICAKLIAPRFSIYYYFAGFCVWMLMHGVMSFKQRPRDRKYWIMLVCGAIWALSLVLWFWICIALLVQLNELGVDTIDASYVLSHYPDVLKGAGDQFTESALSRYLLTLSVYAVTALVPQLTLTVSYFVLFGIGAFECLKLLLMLFFYEVTDSVAIYNFAISIWTISNYFDSRWGTRERHTDSAASSVDTTVDTQCSAAEQTLLFRDLSDSPRPALYGWSIACAFSARYLLPFALPLLQYIGSALFAVFWLLLAEGVIVIWTQIAMTCGASLAVLLILLVASKLRNIECAELEKGAECGVQSGTSPVYDEAVRRTSEGYDDDDAVRCTLEGYDSIQEHKYVALDDDEAVRRTLESYGSITAYP